MANRTALKFFVLQTHAGWIVQSDGYVYPPCAAFIDAVTCAVHEARVAGDFGFASVVLTQSSAGHPCHVHWTYDTDTPEDAVPTSDDVSGAKTMTALPGRPRPPARPALGNGVQDTIYDYTVDRGTKTWKVIHLASGDVARLNGIRQQNLTIDAADGMAALMNRIAPREPVTQER
ncbi:hypothetical protein [Azospirillum halopraeferens]|uniref:hypothetical protein n=1 Tax=Azospirillum halopraeferens TaxID=34010 RepID=UPI000490172A|nr:hypothetical protein [Azospirillum halopraeferens]